MAIGSRYACARESRIRRRSLLRGFTLVELLVVIAIIGILVSLLLPAVQSARESGRRLQCANNLRNLSLGSLQHVQTNGYFPSGGWGWGWSGDPNRGFGRNQPGGWGYSVLPYTEQQALHGMGFGATDAVRRSEAAKMVGTPISIFNCPTRRPVKVRPHVHPVNYVNIDRPTFAGRGDYAANAGDGRTNDGATDTYGPTDAAGNNAYSPRCTDTTGIVAVRSQYTRAAVKDGMSNTLLLGERYLNPDHYDTGKDHNDDQNLYLGFDRDNVCYATGSTTFAPRQDRQGVSAYLVWGSAHSGIFQVGLCDGSVRSLQYSIDLPTLARLANRKDGQIVDGSKL